ncbi:MAG: ADP-ribose pyrophosphatase [Planctomycetes bacterium ADurb.Bin126]|nr:MAG: ADP-ribose pyrophosphatase [Planctomycetes bacterium ADurb.Bin126]HOD83649.1 NUDIX hydrolase [Phycisphaerae bacterium]HQL75785.1 NUDIX hydrolase [Phycisphaerae bacterium]
MNASEPSDKEILWTGKYIRLMRRGRWEFVERVNLSGIIAVVALTDDDKIVLVEQFRVPVDASVIELPAGLVGDVAGSEEEAMETAARREMIEETGYQVAELTPLYEGAASAGLSNEHISLFLARGLTKVGPGGGDESEDIRVHEVPRGELATWLDARRREGKVIDIKVYLALPYCS